MSGTSLDGVDASLIKTDGKAYIEPLGFYQLDYPKDFKKKLMNVAQGDVPLSDLLRLERALTAFHVQAVQTLLQEEDLNLDAVDLIGFHGQTIRHLPEEGLTWQIGDPHYLAAQLKTPVVSDFRRYDMALGGQGAPLAPLYHAMLLDKLEKPIAVLNLGGVANVTYLGKNGEVIAGDVGPGCSLLDQWAAAKINAPYDEGGARALNGCVDDEWVQTQFNKLDFFHQPLPKSADRYIFDPCLPTDAMPTDDGFANLCALGALCVAEAFKKLNIAPPPLWLAGGGAHNKGLQKELLKHVPSLHFFEEMRLSNSLEADRLEADCFAWLAVRRMLRLPTTMTTTTGATEVSSGGGLVDTCMS